MSEKISLPQQDTEWKVKKDRFQKDRGTPQMLEIFCASTGCEDSGLSLIYQKDGPGQLKRIYLDRIAWAPPDIVDGLKAAEDKASTPTLECSHCNSKIGTPMIYDKGGENRVAYQMQNGTFGKKKYLPKQTAIKSPEAPISER